MKRLIFVLALLVTVPLSAQERPIAGTTVQTTDTTANSLLVGCTVGSTTCTGGIKSGPIVPSQVTVNSVGIIATDGRIPAISSTYFASVSGTNLTGVALLGSLNTFTAFGLHSWTAGNTGINQLNVRNSSAGTTNLARLGATSDTINTYVEAYASTFTTSTYQLQSGSSISGDGAGGLSIAATNASGAIRWYSGGTTLRWGINSAGDHTFGASSVIADSSGTPSSASCTNCTVSAIAGTDYAMRVTYTGVSAGQTNTINFGHTWTNAPVCVATTSGMQGVAAPTTTQVVMTMASGTTATAQILCRGY